MDPKDQDIADILRVSSCDWGRCDEPAVGLRYAPKSRGYLAVCKDHLVGGSEKWGFRVLPKKRPPKKRRAW